jgi:hypothetical protein
VALTNPGKTWIFLVRREPDVCLFVDGCRLVATQSVGEGERLSVPRCLLRVERVCGEFGHVEPVEPLGLLAFSGTAVERDSGAAAVELELSDRVVEARPANEPPVGAR